MASDQKYYVDRIDSLESNRYSFSFFVQNRFWRTLGAPPAGLTRNYTERQDLPAFSSSRLTYSNGGGGGQLREIVATSLNTGINNQALGKLS